MEEESHSDTLSDVPVLDKSRLDWLSSSDEVERFSLRVCASVPVWELLRSGSTNSRTLCSMVDSMKFVGNLLKFSHLSRYSSQHRIERTRARV